MSTPLLTEIAAALPRPTAEQIAAVFAAADPNQFATRGRRVASHRVLTDTSRLYGIAASFWSGASEAQQEVLVGFSPEMLAVGVHTALDLDHTVDRFDANEKADHTVREVTAAELGDQWTQAVRFRDLAISALAPIAGEDKAREAALRGALGTAESADDLARGLRDLATLARAWIRQAELAPIVALTRVNERFAARLDAAADTLSEAADAARTRMTFRVSQGDLDVLDGKNLYVLKLIVDVFDDAHAIDPSIPRLILISLANAYKRRGRRKVAAGASTQPSRDDAGEGDGEGDGEADGDDVG